MRSKTRVAVIGGGIAGCSALYHLTREGVADCLLIERDELTSGTTWHSAAQVTSFGANQVMVGLKKHSIALYHELAADPDMPVGYHYGYGSLRLATTPDHLDGYRHFIGVARGMGVELELLDAAECRRRHPLLNTDGLLGALWDPHDGDIDPTQLCRTLVHRACKAGAEVARFNPVIGLTQLPGGDWIVHTRKGEVRADIVVNAAGYRCNEVAAMMGIELPVACMEHQYVLTEPLAQIAAADRPLPTIRCPHDDFYARQEKHGLLVGFYEQNCRNWGMGGIPPDFTMALCPDDLGRVSDVMEGAFNRLPVLQEAGIRTVVNGPITYTPDGLPLVGPVPGKRNAYCINGLRAGLGEGGGHGWLLAQIIARGEACYDTWPLDPRRFTRYATPEFTAVMARQEYQNEFRFHMPREHRPAGRPAKTTPLYHRLKAAGACFGVVNGWERAAFFKPREDFAERHSFRFNNTHEVVADEVAAVRDAAGLCEVSGFNRFILRGAGVHDWLDAMSCSRISRKIGKVSLAYFLNAQGTVKMEATLANLEKDCVWLGSAAAAESHDMDWLSAHFPDDGGVAIESATNTMTSLVLAGPRAREILARAAPREDWSADGFGWLTARRVKIGPAAATAFAVSFSGESAWELHIPNEQLNLVFDILREAGRPALRLFGSYAVESMRIEKGYRHWKADLLTEYDPFESGLGRFVNMDKGFLGKDALTAREKKPRRRFVSLAVDCADAPAQPGDALLAADGRTAGSVTSAAFGHRVRENLAMGFVEPDYAEIGGEIGVLILGEIRAAKVVAECRYDPQNIRVRKSPPDGAPDESGKAD
ncbi:MAG: GcvT family protein [Gammaproteobacteria bacterium]